MNAYERKQWQRVHRWQQRKPDLGTRLLARPTGLAGRAFQKLVPESAIRAALHGLNDMALRLSSEHSLVAAAGVSDIEQLKLKSLQDCDQLARRELRRAMAMAGAGGAAFGVFGAMGLAADVPSLLVLAMRTIHRTGLCYGERAGQGLIVGIFALASANTAEEKQAALAALESDLGGNEYAAARDGLERAAERELAKEAAVYGLQALAQRVSINLGRRKLAGGLPLLGAVVGSAVNVWYIRDVAQIAQQVFQERWLRHRYPDLHF